MHNRDRKIIEDFAAAQLRHATSGRAWIYAVLVNVGLIGISIATAVPPPKAAAVAPIAQELNADLAVARELYGFGHVTPAVRIVEFPSIPNAYAVTTCGGSGGAPPLVEFTRSALEAYPASLRSVIVHETAHIVLCEIDPRVQHQHDDAFDAVHEELERAILGGEQ